MRQYLSALTFTVLKSTLGLIPYGFRLPLVAALGGGGIWPFAT